MNLGWLFLKRTDKQGWFRNVVIVFAVMLATATLLSAMALGNAFSRQMVREGWARDFRISGEAPEVPLEKNTHGTLINSSFAQYDDKSIKQVGLYQFSDNSPLPKGLVRQPGDKEIFVSASLMEYANQNLEFKKRYDGYDVKIGIPNEMLASPESLIEVYKLQVADKDADSVRLIKDSFESALDREMQTRTAMIIKVFMALCGIGVCFPLLVLVISATRVGMVQREQRYAALSLIGTSKKQINQIILAETLAASGLAVVLGSGLFVIFKYTILANLQFNKQHFFTEDITVEGKIFAGVIGLVLAIAVLVNWIALRKVKTSPLGVVKNQKRLRKPTMLGLLPLIVAGLGIWKLNQLGPKWFLERGGQEGTWYFIGIFVLMMIGLLMAGSYLTYLASKVMNLLSRKAPTVMASKRLGMFARPIFSSVSGVVLALFVGSFFMSVVASVEQTYEQYYKSTSLVMSVRKQSNQANMIRLVGGYKSGDKFQQIVNQMASDPQLSAMIKQAHQVMYFIENFTPQEDNASRVEVIAGEVYSCANLTKFTQHVCPAGLRSDDEVVVKNHFSESGVKTTIVPLSTELRQNGQMSVHSVIFETTNAEDYQRVRRALQNLIGRSAYEGVEMPGYVETVNDEFNPMAAVQGLAQAVMAGTVLTIIVAGFSLAVATIGALFERKKSFSNLRLMGIEVGTLNKVILIESLVPLVLASVVAVAAGILTTKYLVSVTSNNFIFAMPSAEYFIMVGVSLVATVGIVLAILPLLKTITNFENNRTE